MLFYNHKYEFIGIDEEGLKLLNYGSLNELLEVCSDVADLFAKEPGYIHNFKSFGWIGFLLHADSDARSAIVHGNGRTFSCTLEVSKLFLCEEPSQTGYMINMTHIQSISGDDIKPFVAPPKPVKEAPKAADETNLSLIESAPSVLPDYTQVPAQALSEPGILDVPTYTEPEFETFHEPAEDLYPPFALPETEIEEVPAAVTPVQAPPVTKLPETAPQAKEHYTAAEKEFLNNLKVSPSYKFDPNVAAGELGLPVDLIEEFIGDFIQQSYDFKTDLFEAALKGDMNNLKILSHKLKGVAANLRIEDAFETLNIINTSNDPIEIDANLKYFYAIIAKLEGKEPVPFISPTPAETEPAPFEAAQSAIEADTSPIHLDDDDIYAFAFKQHADEPAEAKVSVAIEDEEFLPSESELSLPEPETDVQGTNEEAKEYYIPDEPVESAPSEAVILPLHYDKENVASSLGIDTDFLDELIHEYKSDALQSGLEISNAVAAFDTCAWKKSATQLKGISDNLRLNEISGELAILSETNDAQEAHKASKRLNGFLEQL